MSEKMNKDNLRFEVEEDIGVITHNSLEELQKLWEETYEPSLCGNNLRIMRQHVKSFYEEIINEMKTKREAIQTDINKMYEEADTLRRLLKVEFELAPKKMPLHSLRAHLDESLQNLREQLQQRNDEIRELQLQQEELCEELEEDPRELRVDPLPTIEEILDFQRHLDNLKGLKEDRCAEVIQLRRSIKSSLLSLEICLLTDTDNALVNDDELPLKSSDLVKLREMKSHFETLCHELAQSIDRVRKKLNILWDYVKVEDEWRAQFDAYTEPCQSTYDKLLEELNERELEKKQNLKQIIESVREEICDWWDKTLKSELEKSRFTNFNSEYYTEDLLTLHEMELESLKDFYATNEKIFELIAQRKELWDRMVALEKSACDKNRFNNRGGKLLLEERERKTISVKLPKIEVQLRELLQDYQEKNHRQFTMYGEDVLTIIEVDWAKRKLDKEKLSSARKMGTTATPNPGTSRRLLTPTPSRTDLTTSKSLWQRSKTVGAKPNPSTGLKRKMDRHPEESIAKRNILGDLASPNVFLQPKPVKKVKHPKKVLDTIQYRDGNRRRSSGRQKRRISGKLVSRGSHSKMNIGNSGDSDSISYECFESYLGENSPCRSSVLEKIPTKAGSSKIIKPIPPTIVITKEGCDLKTGKSSRRSPSPSPSKKAKDLPIIM